MKQLLTDIIQSIATNPDEVVITEQPSDNGTTYTISVAADDMGRIIGKSGKVIKAIRSIAHVAAIRNQTHYRINVAEVEDQPEDQPEEQVQESENPEVSQEADSQVAETEENSEEVVIMDSAEEEAPAPNQDVIQEALETTEEEK